MVAAPIVAAVQRSHHPASTTHPPPGQHTPTALPHPTPHRHRPILGGDLLARDVVAPHVRQLPAHRLQPVAAEVVQAHVGPAILELAGGRVGGARLGRVQLWSVEKWRGWERRRSGWERRRSGQSRTGSPQQHLAPQVDSAAPGCPSSLCAARLPTHQPRLTRVLDHLKCAAAARKHAHLLLGVRLGHHACACRWVVVVVVGLERRVVSACIGTGWS